MSNRITELFQSRGSNGKGSLLNVYFTAGFPHLNDTRRVLLALQNAGVDMVEIGIPYSDPVADGETIQASNQRALENGMTVRLLFGQLKDMREEIQMPVLLMSYFNPIYQYGIEEFCKDASEAGVDGLILPDLPLEEFNSSYRNTFEKYGLLNIFLITPQTSPERIRQIDETGRGFIYMVSSSSVTGSKSGVSDGMEAYFERVHRMDLKNPRLIGFGIKDRETFLKAAKFGQGAIIGSAFIRILEQSRDMENDINEFISNVKGNSTQVLSV